MDNTIDNKKIYTFNELERETGISRSSWRRFFRIDGSKNLINIIQWSDKRKKFTLKTSLNDLQKSVFKWRKKAKVERARQMNEQRKLKNT